MTEGARIQDKVQTNSIANRVAYLTNEGDQDDVSEEEEIQYYMKIEETEDLTK